MTPSLEAWLTKSKEAHSPLVVRLILLDTNPVVQCLRDGLQPRETNQLAEKLPRGCLNSFFFLDIYSRESAHEEIRRVFKGSK